MSRIETTLWTAPHAFVRGGRLLALGTSNAQVRAVIDVALTVFALIAGGVALDFLTPAAPAPGLEDERGPIPVPEAWRLAEDHSDGNPS